MYAFYYAWRYDGNNRRWSFVLYILAAVTYNLYACIWVCAAFTVASRFDPDATQDYLTDWSLLRPHAKYPLLRNEILCSDYVSVSQYPKEFASRDL